MSVGQTGQASLWGGQENIVLQVRSRRGNRVIPSVGTWPIVFLPVTQDWHSWRWLSSQPHLHQIIVTAQPDQWQASSSPRSHPSSLQTIWVRSLLFPLLHHNNLFPAPFPVPASPLLISGMAVVLFSVHSVCLLAIYCYPLFLSKVKMYFSMQTTLKLKFRIENVRRYSSPVWSVKYFIIATCLLALVLAVNS